jgi:hypothetical protein
MTVSKGLGNVSKHTNQISWYVIYGSYQCLWNAIRFFTPRNELLKNITYLLCDLSIHTGLKFVFFVKEIWNEG